jgi:hypothetical protein
VYLLKSGFNKNMLKSKFKCKKDPILDWVGMQVTGIYANRFELFNSR